MTAERPGRTMMEVLADVLGEYQQRCAELRRQNDRLIEIVVELQRQLKEAARSGGLEDPCSK